METRLNSNLIFLQRWNNSVTVTMKQLNIWLQYVLSVIFSATLTVFLTFIFMVFVVSSVFLANVNSS